MTAISIAVREHGCMAAASTSCGPRPVRTGARWAVGAASVIVSAAAALITAMPARADSLAYLVNVTVRPGYNFANAQAALDYGYRICDKVAGAGYGELITDVKSDFGTSDDYQASYLITQAVGELCPASIWQLRKSAAGYRRQGPR